MSIKLYQLIDPRSNETRYIGVTKHSLNGRLARHICDARDANGTSHRARWIRSLLSLGHAPAIVLIRMVGADEDWRVAEIQTIADAKHRGARLVNGTIGGDGTTGRVYKASAATRAKLSAMRTGLRQSDETKRKRSQTLKRFYEDPEQMARRVALAAAASRSVAGRNGASSRMKAIWGDPVRAAEMRVRMRGKQKRKRDASSLLPTTG